MRRVYLPPTLAACLLCAAPAAEAQPPSQAPERPASYQRTELRTVHFARQSPQVGDQIDQSLSMELRLDTTVRQGNQLLERTRPPCAASNTGL